MVDSKFTISGVLIYFILVLLGIFLKSLIFYCLSFILIGVIIFNMEFVNGFLSPFSPLFVFWVGNFISYVIGIALSERSLYYYNYGYDNVLFLFLLLNVGFVFFIAGAQLGYRFVYEGKKIPLSEIRDYYLNKMKYFFSLTPKKIVILCLLITSPLILFLMTHPGYVIGWIENPYTFGLTFGVGLVSHIEVVALAILLIYSLQDETSRLKKTTLLLLLLFTSVAHTLQAIVYGGRASLLVALLCWGLFYSGYCFKKKNYKKPLLLGIAIIFFGLFYMSTMSLYRVQVGYGLGGTVKENRKLTGKTEALQRAIKKVSENIKSNIYTIGERFFEESGLFIVNLRRIKDENFGFKGFDNFVFQYIPKAIFHSKGHDRGNDILWWEGYRRIVWTHSPITLLGDAYYRFGWGGVMFFYFFWGFLLASLSKTLLFRLVVKSKFVSFILLVVLTKFVLRAYSFDIIGALEIVTYEMLFAGMFSFIVLRKIGIISLHKVANYYLQKYEVRPHISPK